MVNPSSDTRIGGTGGTGGKGGTGGQDGGKSVDSVQTIDARADAVANPDYALDVAKDSQPDAAPASLTINAGADVRVCAGFPTTLGAPAQGGTPPYVYLWTATPACSDCIASPTSAQTTVSPDATTTFKLAVTDSLGASASDVVEVTVPSPTADAGVQDVAVNPGESIQIGTAAQTGYTYAWACDRPTCSLSSATEAQPTVGPSLSTMYTVTATSPEGCIATDSATVWVNLPVSTTPADGATDYPRNAPLFVQFGAAVLESSLSRSTINLREKDSGAAADFSFAYDAVSRILTITPKGAKYSAAVGDYTLVLTGKENGILSNDAVRPQRLAEDVVVNYTISGKADTTRPTIESRSPATSASGVPTNVAVSAVWSEALDPTTVNATSFAVSSGQTAVPGTVTYDPETLTVTFVPSTAFKAMTNYTVRTTGIQDIVGNVATAVSWSFSTGSAADTTPPTVTSVSPAAGATKVSVGGAVTVTFNEAVKPASVIGSVQLTAGTTPVEGSVEYDSATRQAVFTPSAHLTKQTVYTVTVSGVEDTAGNTMATAFSSTFTTANVLFSDTFESDTTQWTLAGTWGLTTSASASPTHSLTDSPAGDYGATSTSATSIPIDISGVSSVSLSYWLSGEMAAGDYLRVEYSTGGYGGWTAAANLSGDLGNGIRKHNITLGGGFGGTELQIRFRLNPSLYSFMHADGAYIDNVLVQVN